MSHTQDTRRFSLRTEKVTIIAAAGDFPLLLAGELKKSGRKLSVLAFRNETSEEIKKYTEEIIWVNVGSLTEIFEALKKISAKNVILAGKLEHKYLFSKTLDPFALSFLSALPDRRAESILFAFIAELKKLGIVVLPSSIGLERLFAGNGVLNKVPLQNGEPGDISLGFKAAKLIASLDVGQTVVVKNGVVVAVEALEGTDETILRSAALAGGGCVVVKVARPNQDSRFDIPVIGIKTLHVLETANIRVLAVDAAKTLLFDKDKFLKKADSLNITIYGCRSE